MLSEFQEELQSKVNKFFKSDIKIILAALQLETFFRIVPCLLQLSAAHRTLENLSKDHQNVCLAYNEEKVKRN